MVYNNSINKTLHNNEKNKNCIGKLGIDINQDELIPDIRKKITNVVFINNENKKIMGRSLFDGGSTDPLITRKFADILINHLNFKFDKNNNNKKISIENGSGNDFQISGNYDFDHI